MHHALTYHVVSASAHCITVCGTATQCVALQCGVLVIFLMCFVCGVGTRQHTCSVCCSLAVCDAVVWCLGIVSMSLVCVVGAQQHTCALRSAACVAVCWRVLQHVAACCSVLQCVADTRSQTCTARCSVLQCIQCVAVCCSILQSVAVCYSVLQYQ